MLRLSSGEQPSWREPSTPWPKVRQWGPGKPGGAAAAVPGSVHKQTLQLSSQVRKSVLPPHPVQVTPRAQSPEPQAPVCGEKGPPLYVSSTTQIILFSVVYTAQLSKPSIRSNGTTAVEGQDTVEITCDPPFLKTTYTWRLNGKELPGDTNVSLSQGNTTLTLLKVSRHLKGRYECKVQNPLGVFRSNPFTLDVFCE